MVLKNVEQDPVYGALLRECLEEVRALSEPEGGMTLQEGYIFISAPNSMTPSHVDPEHNFLLQIKGTKEMHVGRFDDTVEEQLQLERIYLGGHRNLSQEPDSARCFALTPGRRRLRAPGRAALRAQRPGPVDLVLDHVAHAGDRARLARAPHQRAPAQGRSSGRRRPGRSVARDRVKAYASSAATAVELVAAKARRR